MFTPKPAAVLAFPTGYCAHCRGAMNARARACPSCRRKTVALQNPPGPSLIESLVLTLIAMIVLLLYVSFLR